MTKKTVTRLLLSLIILSGTAACMAEKTDAREAGEKKTVMKRKYKGHVYGPDFPKGRDWLNTSNPISIKDLRGKFVVLDFWTYCCINCMHILPDLKKLEKKYEKELVVIGVHSAKFDNEKETESIRNAVLRYEIKHPVVNDNDFTIWNSYAASAWPTLVVLNPEGKIIEQYQGEGFYADLNNLLKDAIKEYDQLGLLKREPFKVSLEQHKEAESVLAFPGKLFAHEQSNTLFISDSNHNRIISVDLKTSEIKEVIGSGNEGLQDGDFTTAMFNHPQGLYYNGEVLYVADTENHTLRAVNFKTRKVTTVAGNGQQAPWRARGGKGTSAPLNSPWDLVKAEGKLYIAMAGSHQLWVYDPVTGETAPFAGTGAENIKDGPGKTALLAQPSGLTTDGKRLYFADSEVSAVRSADLGGTGYVYTYVGKGLFEFGDKDGIGYEASLQHPLGVAYQDGKIYIADTYNNKIKSLNLADKSVKTFLGTGKAGLADGKPEQALFNEPGGLSVANGKLYISDTNNHLIRIADLKTGEVKTLNFKNPEKLVVKTAENRTVLNKQLISAKTSELEIRLDLPEGYKLNDLAPFIVKISEQSENITAEVPKFSKIKPALPVKIPVKVSGSSGKLNLDLTFFYCKEGKESVCLLKDSKVTIPFQVEAKSKPGLEVVFAGKNMDLVLNQTEN